MPEYKKYSRDIWDYIKELSYMPSREDRGNLFLDKKKRDRVKLWDYFFRIKPKDAGIPQRKEIASIKKEVRGAIRKCEQRENEVLDKIDFLEKKARKKAFLRVILGLVFLGTSILLIRLLPTTESLSEQKRYLFYISFSFAWLFVGGLLISILYIKGGEKKEINELTLELKELKKILSERILKAKKRISTLKKEVARLRRQIPKPLSGKKVREWLDEEFNKLWHYTKTEIALVREIIEIQSKDPENKIKNPLSILGPGELQREFPRRFLESVNKDLYKHIRARQTYPLDHNKYGVLYDILYGVYFLEYIVIAEDMLVTHCFFYDFIDDRVSSEYTAEQYYTDVVALSIEKKDRKLPVESNNYVGNPEVVHIEDSPTFTLSLKSGEIHKVTFVSQNYFESIKTKLQINPNHIDKIYWIGQSQRTAEHVIKSLREYLRHHKALP